MKYCHNPNEIFDAVFGLKINYGLMLNWMWPEADQKHPASG